jgi:RNA polymerase sigma-70 factor (ECF subfamily)
LEITIIADLMRFLSALNIRAKISGESISPDSLNDIMLSLKNAGDSNQIEIHFNKLYDILLKPLANKLKKDFHTLDSDSLKDIMQEGWFKVLKHRSSYAEGNNVFNWIYTIIKNTAIDYLRKNKIYSLNIGNSAGSNVNDNDGDFPADYNAVTIASEESEIIKELHSKDVARLVREAIESITDKTEQELVKMKIYDELKYEEIAGLMNMPLSTVHYKINKACKFLRNKLSVLMND